MPNPGRTVCAALICLFEDENLGGAGFYRWKDGHLYGYDTDYGIGGDSWIHSTSMMNIGYYVAVAPNNPSANVRDLPFNT